MLFSVKYKGRKYKSSLRDKVQIECIKLLLLIKRIVRRVRLLVPKNTKLYILLSIIWGIFGVITYWIGQYYKEPEVYTVFDVAWELKNSYFTSVLLALFISGYNQVSGYREKLIYQHELYCDTMHEFEKLFMPFIGKKLLYYMVFYNDECLKATLEYINDNLKGKEIDLDNYKEIVEDILIQLDKVNESRKKNCVIGMHNNKLLKSIRDSEKHLKRILRNAKSEDDILNELPEVAWGLFRIVADIRRPWRWDIDNDKKILKLLSNNEENGINEDFYFSMHLYGYQLR